MEAGFESRLKSKMTWYFMDEEKVMLKSGKPWKIKFLNSREVTMSEFLKLFEEEAVKTRIYYHNSERQRSVLSQLKRDGQTHFPPNSVVLHMDFTTNVKRFGSLFVASNESRNPKEFGVESYVLYYRSPEDSTKFKMRVISAIDDDSKHDTYTTAVNLDEVIKRVKSMDDIGTVDRVILISDGSTKEYKSANAFARKKMLARKYNIAIFHHFYCTDDGKGLVDSMGSIFHEDYKHCISKIKLEARKVVKIAEWMNLKKKSFEEGRKNSRLKGDCRSYFAVSLEDTQACRATGNPYESICGVNGEGVTLSNFCYAFLPDEDNDVWVRELSCPGCEACADEDFRQSFPLDGHLGCKNSDVCGNWIPYPILKTGEKDPRKVGKNGEFLGKRMWVPYILYFFRKYAWFQYLVSNHLHAYLVKVCGKCHSISKRSSKFVQYVFASQSHATKKNAHVTKGKVCFCTT